MRLTLRNWLHSFSQTPFKRLTKPSVKRVHCQQKGIHRALGLFSIHVDKIACWLRNWSIYDGVKTQALLSTRSLPWYECFSSYNVCEEKVSVAQSCSFLCGPMGSSPPDSSVPAVLQARRPVGSHSLPQGIFPTQGSNQVSHVAGRSFIIWTTSSVQSLSHVWLFVTPWTAAHQVFLSITNSQSLLRLMSIASVMPSNHLILCHLPLFFPQSFPASGSLQTSQLFASGGQSIGVSASTSVLPVNSQDWSPLGWTGTQP